MIALLRNPVRHFAWGSPTVIPELLGTPPDGRPYAELWLGTHSAAPSVLAAPEGDRPVPGELPFLMKVLAAATPLSLQVHPSREHAAAGHAAENERGVPAADRCFPDANHKPELVCALSPFRLAVGIRPLAETADLLDALAVPALADAAATLRATPTGAGVRTVLATWLRMPTAAAAELAQRVATAVAEVPPPQGAELVWAGVARLATAFPGDIGPVVSLLMHHLELAPGDGLFVPAGTLHTYMAGTAIEIMAASDNVARAGLTPKHVNVDTVLQLADTEPGPPLFVRARPLSAVEDAYDAPVPDFRLSRLRLAPAQDTTVGGADPQILLVLAGAAEIRQGVQHIAATRGQAVYADGAEPVDVRARDGGADVFRATSHGRES